MDAKRPESLVINNKNKNNDNNNNNYDNFKVFFLSRYPADKPVCKYIQAQAHSGPITGLRYILQLLLRE